MQLAVAKGGCTSAFLSVLHADHVIRKPLLSPNTKQELLTPEEREVRDRVRRFAVSRAWLGVAQRVRQLGLRRCPAAASYATRHAVCHPLGTLPLAALRRRRRRLRR